MMTRPKKKFFFVLSLDVMCNTFTSGKGMKQKGTVINNIMWSPRLTSWNILSSGSVETKSFIFIVSTRWTS